MRKHTYEKLKTENKILSIPQGDILPNPNQPRRRFDYDELEPNIKESDLAVGSSVWVGFQKYDYVEGNGKYNQIFAYHIEVKE